MRRTIMLSVWVSIMLLAPGLAQATIERIEDDGFCKRGYGFINICTGIEPYALLPGKTITVTLVGRFVDLATAVEVTGPAGVSASSVGTASSSKTIRLTVTNDATPGLRSLKLRYLVEASGPDTLNLVVLRRGVIGNITVPTPTEPFRVAELTIAGTNIDNADVHVASSGSGGNLRAGISSTSNTATQAVVSLQSQTVNVRINGVLRLFDKAGGAACGLDARYCYQKASGGSDITFSVVGPNFVSLIAALKGDTPDYQSWSESIIEENVLKIIVTLKEAAKTGGEKVFWQVTPATSFVTAVGSSTTYSSSGVNSVTVPAGQTRQELRIKLERLPAGCPSQGCVGQVQAKTQGQPEYLIQTFQMIPGTPLSPTNTPRIP